ncbi:MAG: putative lipid II flippase FtsW [Patescibacteria group bacterium]
MLKGLTAKSSGRPDYLFISYFFGILFLGLVMLSSASSVVSFQKFGSGFYYISHQILFGALPGLVLFFLASRIDYHIWKRAAFLLILVSIVLLVLVFVPGLSFSYGGATRWVHLGPILFQPSEAVKLTFLLYLATWLSSKGEKNIKDFSYGFMPFMALLGCIALLIILEPDIGTMAVIVAIAFSMYFIAGAHLGHIVLAASGAGILFFILINTASYRLQRFMTFLHPELDPQGIGYHINQALLAIGSGGLLGRGFGHSRQKYAYLPEATGDSIFAIIAEELGFILSAAIVILFTLFALQGYRIASEAPDDFGRYLCVGIMSWVVFQTFINIAAMLSLLPLTGIPLPFVSYGGSSLLVLMTAMGIVVNVSRQSKGGHV